MQNTKMMHRAIQLAKQGCGAVSPNPLVGAVITKDGKIIGEGFHQKNGGPHAEINAIKNQNVAGGTMFVTLEPCNHFGKTPPCTQAIIQSGIKKIFVATLDPNSKMQGKSIDILRNAGIEVEIGLLEIEAMEMNRFFHHFMITKLPWITIKLAISVDNFIAREDGTSKWISSKMSRKEVHKMRAEFDAVMVGTKTVLVDNPQLTVRDTFGRNPARIVLDRGGKLGNDLAIFEDNGAKVFYFATHNRLDLPDFVQQYILSPNEFCLKAICEIMGQENILSILVEGGSQLAQSILSEKYWNEFVIYRSRECLETGISFDVSAVEKQSEISMKKTVGSDQKIVFRKKKIQEKDVYRNY